jgi:hypothetical protein
MSSLIYNWKRFWCPRGGKIDLSDGGYLYNPDSEYSHYHPQDVVSFEKIVTTSCLILLGEPGIGKSTEIQNAVTLTKSCLSLKDEQILYLNLNLYSDESRLINDLFVVPSFSNKKDLDEPYYIFLDSLDECKLRIDTIINILSQKLNEFYYKNLFLRVSCRTAEWSGELEKNLIKIWGDKFVGVFELSPLRKADVEIALQENNINKESFLSQVYQKEVQPFTMRPITLEFLINIYKTNSALPNTRSELYSKGIRYLIEEPNPSRKESKIKSKYTFQQKLFTTERIAALMLFCGKTALLIDSNDDLVYKDDIQLEEIFGGEIAETGVIEIDEYVIKDVLSSALFTLKEKNRMGSAHQTYIEYLAACYLIRNKLSEDQILNNILTSSTEKRKVIPQLRETTGWLVTLHPPLCKIIMEIDPEVLLNSDVTLQDDVEKNRIVDVILNLFENQELYDLNLSFRKYYHKFNYSGLSAQLKDFIINKKYRLSTREQALFIAEACSCYDLQDDLINVFIDKSEHLIVRNYIGYSLSHIIDSSHKILLKQLLNKELSGNPNDEFENDIEDELKGVILEILWPENISAIELFKLLKKPKNENLYGTYAGFLSKNIIKDLNPDDLPYALEWVSQQESRHINTMSDFGRLIDNIMYLSWEYLENENILNHFVKAVIHLLEDYDFIVEKEKNELFTSELEENDSKRRILIESIYKTFTDPLNQINLLFGTPQRIISVDKDFAWLLNNSLLETDINKKKGWIILARINFNISEESNRDYLIEAAGNNELIFEEFEHLLRPIELNSEEAQKAKKDYLKYNKPNRYEEKRKLFKLEWQENILKLISNLKEQDLKSYWELLWRLCQDPDKAVQYSESQSDITILPGWKYLSEEEKGIIIEASKFYLINADPDDQAWLTKNIIHRPSTAGYKALRLLETADKNYFNSIENTVWERWSATIIAYPLLYQDSQDLYHEQILKIAYIKVRDAITKAFQTILEKECADDKYISITDRFNGFWNNQISEIVFLKMKDPNIGHNSFSLLLGNLIAHNYSPALDYFIALLKEIPPDQLANNQKILLGCAQILNKSNEIYWKIIWPLMKENVEFGRNLIYKVANGNYNFISKLTEREIADLYLWLTTILPPSESRIGRGSRSVTPEYSATIFRDRLIDVIKFRGNNDSIKSIEFIKTQLSDTDWLNRILYETKLIYHQKNWIPPKPSEFLKIITDKNKRFINSEIELMQTIIESLKRLQAEMHGVTPSVIDIWNTKPAPITPKYENYLSDFVKRHLSNDLVNIIINREVEIRPGIGNLKGEVPDLLVQTFKKNNDGSKVEPISITIETKCCWHPEFLSGMETQLKDRYLANNQCKFGLYLAGWYLCASWDKSDKRLKKTKGLSKNKEEITKFLSAQAESLSNDDCHIYSFVLDCTIK